MSEMVKIGKIEIQCSEENNIQNQAKIFKFVEKELIEDLKGIGFSPVDLKLETKNQEYYTLSTPQDIFVGSPPTTNYIEYHVVEKVNDIYINRDTKGYYGGIPNRKWSVSK